MSGSTETAPSVEFLKCYFRTGYRLVLLYAEVQDLFEQTIEEIEKLDGYETLQGGEWHTYVRKDTMSNLIKDHLLSPFAKKKKATKYIVSSILKSPNPIEYFINEIPGCRGSKWQQDHSHCELLALLGDYMKVLTDEIGTETQLLGAAKRLGKFEKAGLFVDKDELVRGLSHSFTSTGRTCQNLHDKIGIPCYSRLYSTRRANWSPDNDEDMKDAIDRYYAEFGSI
jgi:hypothetical protein